MDIQNDGIKKFVEALRATDSSPAVDVEKNLDVIEWLASVYGDKSSEVISRLAHAEQTLEQKPEAITDNICTALSDKEVTLLEFLSGIKKVTVYSEKEGAASGTTDSTIDAREDTAASLKDIAEDAVEHGVSPEQRIRDQQKYIDRVKKRYTVENLQQQVSIYRTGKKLDGTDASEREKAKAGPEARRLQSMLLSLNTEPKDYIAELEEVNATLPKMGKDVKMSIVIPAYREEGRIQKALESWFAAKNLDGTPLDPNQIELLVLVNRPNEGRDFDRTQEEIEEFKRTHPEWANHVQTVEKTFNFPNKEVRQPDGSTKIVPDVSMGLIYRYATDIALLRNLSREGENPEAIANHVIRTGGGDVAGRNPEHVARILSSFSSDPKLEQYVSLSDYDPEIYKKIPLLFFARTLQDEMNEELTHGYSNIGLGTYRASIYAAAGGFEPRERIAEEKELSQRMRKVLKHRGDDLTTVRKRDLVLNALDDPKRDIAALFVHKPLTASYDDYDINEAIRDIRIDRVLADPLPPEAEFTTENASLQADAIFKFYLGEFFDPEKGVFEPTSTTSTIEAFRNTMNKLGVSTDGFQILFDGKPFEKDEFEKIVREKAIPINVLRSRFLVSVGTLPDAATLDRYLEERFRSRGGNWALHT